MIRLGLWIATVILALDQAVKWWLLNHVLTGPEAYPPITPFFSLVRVWNQGISFGILGGDNAPYPLLLVVLAFSVSFVLMIWLGRTGRPWICWGLGFIIGGALGNAVDRLRYGAVFDFLDFHAFGVHWPAFNLADAAITVGVGMILIDALLERRETPK
ncbi:MAG: signal peptidase II [Alphaproteobacteria bacterium]|nr:signal peptidase II [Alphaproteobacteria bacterium]